MNSRRTRAWPIAVAFVGIILLGAVLRLTGTNWDEGTHLHPDERFLTMVQGAMSLPDDTTGYLDTNTSKLNPRNVGYSFFVYGTWPMTVVHVVADRMASEMGRPSMWMRST